MICHILLFLICMNINYKEVQEKNHPKIKRTLWSQIQIQFILIIAINEIHIFK